VFSIIAIIVMCLVWSPWRCVKYGHHGDVLSMFSMEMCLYGLHGDVFSMVSIEMCLVWSPWRCV